MFACCAMSASKSSLVTGLGIGLLLGGVAAFVWQRFAGDVAPPMPGTPAVTPSSPLGAPADPRSGAASSERSPVPTTPANDGRAEAPSAPDVVERESTDVFTAALRDYAIAEARRGWRELRNDAMPDDVLQQLLADYEQQVRTLPAAWGKRAAEQAIEVEGKVDAFAKGDVLTLLATVDGSEPQTKEFVAGKRFTTLFDARGGGSVVDGTTIRAGDKIAAGAVLTFPAGVYALGNLAEGNEPFPTDVTVRGASMDATLLVVDDLSARSPVDRLSIEDCTVFCENAITDMRSHAAVLSLRRVRIVGFDCGAGSAVAFYLFGKSALRVTECRFEGGYGRAPGSFANLMDTRSLCLARFERCLFDRVGLSDAGRTVRFVDCEMRELLGKAPTDPVYENCRITVIEPAKQWNAEYRRRDLNTLFPQWRERLQR